MHFHSAHSAMPFFSALRITSFQLNCVLLDERWATSPLLVLSYRHHHHFVAQRTHSDIPIRIGINGNIFNLLFHFKLIRHSFPSRFCLNVPPPSSPHLPATHTHTTSFTHSFIASCKRIFVCAREHCVTQRSVRCRLLADHKPI